MLGKAGPRFAETAVDDSAAAVRGLSAARFRPDIPFGIVLIAIAFVLLMGVVIVGSVLGDRGSTRAQRAVM